MSEIIFEDLFRKSEGRPFIYKGKEVKISDKISLENSKTSLIVEFISTGSEWAQGIAMRTKGEFEINGQKISKGIVLWDYSAPRKIEMIVNSKDKILLVYNVWDKGDGTMQYGHNGAALFVENVDGIKVYHCNDGHPDDDFDELIFKIKFHT